MMAQVRRGTEPQSSTDLDRPVVEVVLLALRNISAKEFAAVMSGAIVHLRQAPGYLAHSFGPCAEDVGVFLLLVWWRSIEAHVVEFRQSADHVLWRSLLQSYLQSEPWVRHFEVSEGIGQPCRPTEFVDVAGVWPRATTAMPATALPKTLSQAQNP